MQGNHKGIEKRLWIAADELRADSKLKASEYSLPVLGLIFLISDVPYLRFLIQRKIAAILSAYDDLIENNTRRIKILEEMAQTLYREWFVHFRFSGHEKVRMVDSPRGRISEGWGKIVLKIISILFQIRNLLTAKDQLLSRLIAEYNELKSCC